MRHHFGQFVSMGIWAYTGLLAGTALLLVTSPSLAQLDQEQSLLERRDAILSQDQIFTDDGDVIDQDSVRAPSGLSVAPAINIRTRGHSTEAQTIGWRGRYYGRPYGAYYYGPPRYYSGYRGYYDSPYPYYRGYGYGDYGYGYRGGYYGTPRIGYYDGYYGDGAVRVGPVRVGWR